MTHCYELGKRSIRFTPEYEVIWLKLSNQNKDLAK